MLHACESPEFEYFSHDSVPNIIAFCTSPEAFQDFVGGVLTGTQVFTHRLWCGYEAYLAFQSNKIIQTARPPIWPQVLLAWLLMCPALLVGLIVGAIIGTEESMPAMLLTPGTRATRGLTLLASLISQNTGHNRLCLIVNHVGLSACLACLTYFIKRQICLSRLTLCFQKRTGPVQLFLRSMLLVYFMLAELDRVGLHVASA